MRRLATSGILRILVAVTLAMSLVVLAPMGAAATRIAPNPAPLGTTERVSVATDGAQGDDASEEARISANGQFVVFRSAATDFAPGDVMNKSDIFLRDLESGQTELISANPLGDPANGHSVDPDVSADGRYVVFSSEAEDVVPGDINMVYDIFLRDRQNGTTIRISEGAAEADAASLAPVISDDGAYVAFASWATNLVAGDTNNTSDIFLYEVGTGALTRLSVGFEGAEPDDGSYVPAIDYDGSKVAFESEATNLVDVDNNGVRDIFVCETSDGSIDLVSHGADGAQAAGESYGAAISADGARVAFSSIAANLVEGDEGGYWDVFVADLAMGISAANYDSYIRLVSKSSEGVPGNNHCEGPVALNEDGSAVAFSSGATNIVADDTNGFYDCFVHLLDRNETRRVSVADDGTQGGERSFGVDMDMSGELVTFQSDATELVQYDSNAVSDIFLHTLSDFTGPDVFSNLTSMETYEGSVDIEIWATDDDGVDTVAWNLDGNGWVHVGGSETTLTVDTVGYHMITYKAIDSLGNYSEYVTAEFEVTRLDDAETPRTAGVNRYATAIAASQRAYPDGADSVVLATGANWPDALGGSALAGAVDGPLLLVDAAALSDAVKAEIERLGAHNAFILGGTGAVSAAVEASLVGLLGADHVERIAGADRYATAAAVADEVLERTWVSSGGHAFVATGGNYPDALAGSPIAAANGWPILLAHPVTGDVYVPEAIDHVVVLGGTGAVSAGVEAALKAGLGEENVTREGGENRYGTAALVAAFGVDDAGLFWDGVGVATGESFPDALSGGAMLGVFDTVLLLTPTNSLSLAAADALTANKQALDEVNIIGGTGAVAPSVASQVLGIIE